VSASPVRSPVDPGAASLALPAHALPLAAAVAAAVLAGTSTGSALVAALLLEVAVADRRTGLAAALAVLAAAVRFRTDALDDLAGIQEVLGIAGAVGPSTGAAASWLGAAAVLLGPGCGDPLYRKAIRTSMGATLDVPWGVLADWPGDLRELEARGFTLVALTPDASARALREVVAESAKPLALLLGSEGFGLTSGPMALACAARIPMPNGSADSLNVAAAASIALYEASH